MHVAGGARGEKYVWPARLEKVVSMKDCHRNFGPGNFGPGDQNFQWKIGPAGPIFKFP